MPLLWRPQMSGGIKAALRILGLFVKRLHVQPRDRLAWQKKIFFKILLRFFDRRGKIHLLAGKSEQQAGYGIIAGTGSNLIIYQISIHHIAGQEPLVGVNKTNSKGSPLNTVIVA